MEGWEGRLLKPQFSILKFSFSSLLTLTENYNNYVEGKAYEYLNWNMSGTFIVKMFEKNDFRLFLKCILYPFRLHLVYGEYSL